MVTGLAMRPNTTLSCCLTASENSSPGLRIALAAATASALRRVGAGAGVVPARAADCAAFAAAASACS